MPHLSQPDYQWLMQELGRRGVELNGACGECGRNEWSASDDLFAAVGVEFGTENALNKNGVPSFFSVHCSYCGNTKLFNVNALGFSAGIGNQGQPATHPFFSS